MQTFRSRMPRRGFTLIELLLAMVITTIIAYVLISVTAIAIDSWNRGRSEIRAARQAKFMVDSIAKDFESLVTRRGNTYEWLSAKTAPKLPGNDSTRSYNTATLIFFTAATDRYDGKINTTDDKGGDVSCVSYQLQYKDPISGGSDNNFATFTLYRLLVNPNDAFDNLLGKSSLETAFQAYSTKVPDLKNFVCENIYQYSIIFHIEVTRDSGAGKVSKLTVPVSLGPTAGKGRVTEFHILGSGLDLASTPSPDVTIDELKAGRVAAMEVSLTVISDAGMQQLRSRTDLVGSAMTKFMAKNSFQYSKRVELPCM